MLIPNPILFGPTPPGGAVLAVTSERGGLAGYVVLGQAGPTATVELNTGETWAPIRYPHTLGAGEQLRLTRSSTLPTLTTLHMLAPVDEGPPPAPPTDLPTLENGLPVMTTVLAASGPEDPTTIYQLDLPPGVAELRVTAAGSAELMVALVRDLSLEGPPEAFAEPGHDPTTARLSNPAAGRWYVVCVATGGQPVPGVTVTATWGDGSGPPGESFIVQTDPEGYQTIEGAEVETDAEGYQTIQGAAATADADGYETVERS